MRKMSFLFTGLLFIILFTTCKQFTADIDGYLSYWASEAFIKSATIETVSQNDVSGIASVASDKDAEITLRLHNPHGFQLAMPPARKVVNFAQLTDTQPVAGTDYEMTQSTPNTLQLVYKAGFLQTAEWGEKDISSSITLYAADGRQFKQTYIMKIKANTPPPRITHYFVAKTKGAPAYYVLCFIVPEMDKKVPGGLLHKDIAGITVNGTNYALSVNEAQTAFVTPVGGNFLEYADIEQLAEPDADEVPANGADGWVLYYKTDVEVKDGITKKGYTVRLADAKGLVAPVLNASTKPNKAEPATLRITQGEKIETLSGDGSSETNAIVIKARTGEPEAQLEIQTPTAAALVYATLTEIATGSTSQYEGNPIIIPLSLNGANEKVFKLAYYTGGGGFKPAAIKTLYYKVSRTYTVTFNANGGAYTDGTTSRTGTALYGQKISAPAAAEQPAKRGYTFGGWYKSSSFSEPAWNFDADTVTNDITLYAKWVAGSGIAYKVEHYQQELAGTYPSAATEIDSDLTGTTGVSLSVGNGISLKYYPGFEYDKLEPASPTIAADGSTVVKVLYKRKQITVTFKLNGGNISENTGDVVERGKYGATLTAPTAPALNKTGYILSGWQPTPPAPALSATFPAVDATYTAQWMANTYKVRFNKNDSNASGIMSDQDFTYDESKPLTSNGFTKTGYIFDGWATSAGGSKEYSDKQSVSNLTTTANGTVDLYAKWVASSSTQYKVKHYQQNLNDDGYPASHTDIDNETGTTGQNATVTLKHYTGFKTGTYTATTIAADGSTVVEVRYEREKYAVRFNVDGSAGGSIAVTAVTGGSVTSTSPVTVKHGGSVSFTASPTTGWEVDGWTLDGFSVNGTNTSYTLSGITGNKNVTVKFKKKVYNVTFSVDGGTGGSLDGTYSGNTQTASGGTERTFTVTHDGSVTFTAYPDNGWEVDSWTVSSGSFASGGTTGAANARLDNITGTKNVKVKFKKKVYNVTFSVDGGTGGSLDGTYSGNTQTASGGSMLTFTVAHNGRVDFTAQPDTANGWEVQSWMVDSVIVPGHTSENYTLSNVTGPKTVTVIFKKKTYTVTFSVANGEGTLQGTYGSQNQTAQNGGGIATLTNVPHGASVSFTATPNDGWELDGWTGVSSSSLMAPLTVDGPKTVTVKFKPGELHFNSGGPDAWKRLKEEVEKTEGAHTITISGEITATNDQGNNGKITIRRDLIIKSSGSSASLNASNLSGIFDVNNKLTLENITLKNGKETGNRTGAGAYVTSTLIMKGSSAITNCSAHKGGGVYVNNGTLIMQDSSAISSCTAADNGSGVYVGGTFNMKGDALVDQNNDVYLADGKSITVTGALSHHPAARITPDSYTDGRVLATGAAEKANFKVTPKNGTEYWRYNKVGNEIKFVKAELRITFTKIKCVEVKDGSSEAEYYWTIKVGEDTIDEKKSNQKYMWDAQNKAERSINKFFKRDTNPFPVASIPVNIEIWEYDKTESDDHIGTTKAHLTYDYDNDQWKWAYDSGNNWWKNEKGKKANDRKNPNITIGDGGEQTFTEEYRNDDGDTDVTIKISWKE